MSQNAFEMHFDARTGPHWRSLRVHLVLSNQDPTRDYSQSNWDGKGPVSLSQVSGLCVNMFNTQVDQNLSNNRIMATSMV